MTLVPNHIWFEGSPCAEAGLMTGQRRKCRAENLTDHMEQKGRGSEAEKEMLSRGRERKKGRGKDGWVKKMDRQMEDSESIPVTVCFPALMLCFSPDTFLFLILQDTPASLITTHLFLPELARSGLYFVEPQASN